MKKINEQQILNRINLLRPIFYFVALIFFGVGIYSKFYKPGNTYIFVAIFFGIIFVIAIVEIVLFMLKKWYLYRYVEK